MLFRLLKEPVPEIVYTFAMVESKIGKNSFIVGFEGTTIEIYTKERIQCGEWVRFFGKLVQGVIFCEFVSVLHNVDIKLLIKCLERIN